MKKEKLFALYYGDVFIDIGTKIYLSKLINVKVKTIEYYMSKTWKNKSNYQSWIVIKIEGSEDDEGYN